MFSYFKLKKGPNFHNINSGLFIFLINNLNKNLSSNLLHIQNNILSRNSKIYRIVKKYETNIIP